MPDEFPEPTVRMPPGNAAPAAGGGDTPAAGAEEFPELLGGYRLARKLGQGGMGAVFLAQDLKLHRPVALKVIRPDVAKNPANGPRFLREARAMAALKHDNIVTIYAVGEDKGMPFLAMELLRGMPLDAYLKSGKPLTVKSIVRLGREIARGLACAHAKGLIHRDIKPANIWLEAPNGRAKILDFGLARPAEPATELTGAGLVLGTPHDMSPEQGRGEPLDGRADLFSLGIVLYRALTGKVPFEGATLMAVLTAIGTATPPAVRALRPDTPPRLSDLIDRLLAKKPANRPPTGDAVAAELAQIDRAIRNTGAGSPGLVIDDVPVVVIDETETARPPSRPEPTVTVDDSADTPALPKRKKKRRRNRVELPDEYRLPVVVGVVAFVVAVIFVIGWRVGRNSVTPPSPPTTQSAPAAKTPGDGE